MTAGPPVSVILNCYNHQDYVGEAIESVLRQTHRDLELIIIDNGSTDGTRKVIESFTDDRIHHFLNDENVSVSRRLNEGVAAARGEFVSILYSDDWFLPHKIEKQLAIFGDLASDFGVVYSPAIGFNQLTGERWQRPSFALSGDIVPALFDRFYDGFVDMCSPLTRRECFQQSPFFDGLFADGEMVFFRIALHWSFQFDAEPLVVLRDHGGNMSKAVQKNHDMMVEMFERLEANPAFPREYLGNLHHLKVVANRNHAWIALRMNSTDNRWLRRQLSSAVAAEPSQLLQPRMLAGLIFAHLPSGARLRLNRIADTLKPTPENSNISDTYG
jgi:glycosyltransferase involved in cell wall biosynthesis